MTKFEMYIRNQLGVIEKECLESGITATEWIERHADEFCRKYWNEDMENSRTAEVKFAS